MDDVGLRPGGGQSVGERQARRPDIGDEGEIALDRGEAIEDVVDRAPQQEVGRSVPHPLEPAAEKLGVEDRFGLRHALDMGNRTQSAHIELGFAAWRSRAILADVAYRQNSTLMPP